MKKETAVFANGLTKAAANREDLYGLKYVTPKQITLGLLVGLPLAAAGIAYMYQTIVAGRAVNWGAAIGIKLIISRLLLVVYSSEMSKKRQSSAAQMEHDGFMSKDAANEPQPVTAKTKSTKAATKEQAAHKKSRRDDRFQSPHRIIPSGTFLEKLHYRYAWFCRKFFIIVIWNGSEEDYWREMSKPGAIKSLQSAGQRTGAWFF